jgi:hypothetical protein
VWRVAEGYIKAYRKLLDWEWYDNQNTKVLFLHCLLKANFKQSKWRGQTIPKGAFITSLSNLAKELCLSVREIRTALNNLKSTSELTSKTTNKYTLIKVENWALYQSDDIISDKQNDKQLDKRKTNKRQASDKQTTTDEECKERKNVKNINTKDLKECGVVTPRTTFVKPTILEIETYCNERNNKVDPQVFFDFYESKGWMVGKNKMKNWQACVRTWEKERGNTNGSAKPKKPDIELPWFDKYQKDLEREEKEKEKTK